jgi:hypothetical protein
LFRRKRRNRTGLKMGLLCQVIERIGLRRPDRFQVRLTGLRIVQRGVGAAPAVPLPAPDIVGRCSNARFEGWRRVAPLHARVQ